MCSPSKGRSGPTLESQTRNDLAQVNHSRGIRTKPYPPTMFNLTWINSTGHHSRPGPLSPICPRPCKGLPPSIGAGSLSSPLSGYRTRSSCPETSVLRIKVIVSRASSYKSNFSDTVVFSTSLNLKKQVSRNLATTKKQKEV